MNIEIFLENNGTIPKGFDWNELEQGIQKNAQSFASAASGQIVDVKRKSPPGAAQGEDMIIQWLIEVATNPKMAIVYYRMACFALNELITASKKKASDQAENENVRVRFKVLGKEIQLPASVSAVEEFLKMISE